MTLIYTVFDDKTFSYNNIESSVTSDLYVPLNVDTEFYNRPLTDSSLADNPSQTITVQISGIQDDEGKIYTHPDSFDIARHELFKESFIAFDYLIDNEYPISYHRPEIITHKLSKEIPSLPKIHFDLYLHFACADLIRIFQGDYKNDVRDLILNSKNSGNGQGITQNRRLQTFYRGKGGYKNYCFTNWIVEYQGISYQCVLSVYDTIAIAGNISYLDLAELVGYELPYKNLLNEKDKENMVDTYKNNKDFDNYALGDLHCYDLLLAYNNQRNHLSQPILNLKDDEILKTRLTIGSQKADEFGYVLKKHLSDKKMFIPLTKNANSDNLRKEKDTRAILSKVDGGRCYNNRPLDTLIIKKGDYKNLEELVKGKDILCDIDISGAYGKGLALQDYPLGNPKNFCHQLNKDNKYYTLREFLEKHGNELVDGLWIMRVSTSKLLKYPQDLITSWVIDPNKIERLTDPTIDDLSVDYPKEGYCKIFTNEIHLGMITSDILQWIDNICSQSQRKELYDTLLVINAMWYDKTKELKTVDEVEKHLSEFNDKDESYYEGDNLFSIQKNSYYWTRLNIGELFIKKLIKERSKYPKSTHKKENEYYKLCINTTYGVLVSKYFHISNTVVGNNITARTRCMMWYLEKGLNGFQSITDGCVFELDNVVYPVNNKRLTANNLVKGYQRISNERLWFTDKLKINKYWIGNKDDINYCFKYGEESKDFINMIETEYKDKVKIVDDKIYIPHEYLKKLIDTGKDIGELSKNKYNIENDILEHLKNLFPKVDVLHKNIIDIDGNEQKGYFTLEIKSFSNKAIFHGNANYYLDGVKELKDGELIEKNEPVIKMRGYGKRSFIFETNTDIETLEDNEQDWIEKMMSELDDENIVNEELNLLGLNIPEKFFDSLKNDLTRVRRQNYYIENKIIKCKDYKSNYNTYKNYNIDIGYSIPESKLLTELVLSQFTYPDIQSFKRWIKNHYSHKSKYGQGYESCFLNEDDSLNYQLMIETIDKKIKDGKSIKLKNIGHPEFKNLSNRKIDIQLRLLK